MFHYTQMGSFGEPLKKVADIYGYVPEYGDKPSDFYWNHDHFKHDFDSYGNGYEGYALEKWEERLKETEELIITASQEITKWNR